MAKTIIINGVTYQDVPFTQSPLASDPTQKAKFYDISDTTVNSGDKVLSPYTCYGSDGTKYTGSIPSKSAQTYIPTSSDQIVSASQFLSGAQTFKGVTVTNLSAGNIKAGITVKVGCSTDDDSVTSVVGTLTSAVITQDPTTKVLTIE